MSPDDRAVTPPAARPHARATPAVRARRLVGDGLALAVVVVALLAGQAVHGAVDAVAEPARDVRAAAGGLADDLRAGADRVDGAPLVGDALAEPLTGAASRADAVATASGDGVARIERLADVLRAAVVGVPLVGAVAARVLPRLRRRRQRAAVDALAARPGGDRLLALRALVAGAPDEVLALHPDPVGAWAAGDPVLVRALVDLERRAHA
ncbi:hypothetical protein [Cellulomonas marina]|uniref:Uncharacterized protein n=1 Tax=Cellulomonas marina TaxID=988821 RepID=A0A1I0X6B8_9CELL|nr:hypothetical protein [Cellulomonas marina]GIG28975.1 hypothetical protein Cma02nite_15750 [Cellulomonas marina]SFA96384.1 hypothetical protein SAMN05421867_104153 [Cellulomonas marina]